MASKKYSDEKMVEALRKAHGMVHAAAKALGCNPTTIYDRIKVSKPVADCVAGEVGMLNDMSEMKLYEAILAGEAWAIKYRLSTKARDRGYGK